VRRRPELAAGLILIDTKEGADGAEGRANRFAQIDRVEAEGPGFFIGEMMPKMLTAPTLRLDDRRAEIVKQAMNRASAAGVQSALRAMASRPDSSDVLRSFDRPVLVVVGREDVITPLPDANRMASLAPRSTLVEIPDAAHLSNVERPEVFNTSAAAFIENLQ
jgi:pimeloyl-ACP methyl ester carboxylesterase